MSRMDRSAVTVIKEISSQGLEAMNVDFLFDRISLGHPAACVTGAWRGQGLETGNRLAPEPTQETRRVPAIQCTLCLVVFNLRSKCTSPKTTSLPVHAFTELNGLPTFDINVIAQLVKLGVDLPDKPILSLILVFFLLEKHQICSISYHFAKSL